MIGRTFGRYHIIERLGEGGMGSVWKAEDTLLGRIVAVKVMAADMVDSPGARRRFLREARAASMLEHPGIVTVFDAGIDGDDLYLIQALIEGDTVQHRLTHGALPPAEAVDIAADACDALAHAHERGVIHRDVTPRNVMIARDGHAKLIDFGIARHQGSTSSSRAAMGTFAYMAPEVLEGRVADARADLYGLGVVLYEMLTGALPFTTENSAALTYAIMNQTRAGPRVRVPDLDPKLDRVVLRAIARDPAKRYPNATEMAVALRSVLASIDPHGPGRRESDTTDEPPRSKLPRGAKVASASQGRLATPARSRSRRGIAVLPFRSEHEGDDASADALARGLAEMLSIGLGRIPQLQVSAVAQVASDADPSDLLKVARRAGAQLLLTGTVHRAGDRLRVGFSLIDPRRRHRVSSDWVDGVTSDLFTLEDSLVASVARALQVGHPGLSARHGPNVAVHEQYLRALGYLQRTDNEASIDGAIGLLEELLAREGDTALVHAALGRACLRKWELSLDPIWRTRAEGSCRVALKLDPHSPDVLGILARVHVAAGRSDQAIEVLEHSLEIRPDNPETLIHLTRAYEAQGRYSEASRAARLAIGLRPHHWLGHDLLAFVHFRQGEYEEAIESWKRALELTPDNAPVHGNVGASLFQLGRLDEAAVHYARSIEILPNARAYQGLGTVRFFQGDRRAAVALLQKSVDLAPLDPWTWGNLADAQRWVPGLEASSRAGFDRAIGLAREHLRLNPKDARGWSRLAHWLAKREQTRESLTAIQRALEIAPQDVGCLSRAITVYHLADDRERAVACLRSAIDGGYGLLEFEHDPELEALREDPEVRRALSDGPRGSGASEHSARGGRMRKKVNIRLKNGSVDVSPNSVKIMPQGTKYAADEVEWKSHDGDATILFNKDGTPFAASRFDMAKSVDRASGTAGPHPGRTVYRYSVELTEPDGTIHTVDPQVDVDPGGPRRPTKDEDGKKKDGKKKGGKKKGGKKSAKKKGALKKKGARKKGASKKARRKGTAQKGRKAARKRVTRRRKSATKTTRRIAKGRSRKAGSRSRKS